MKTIKQARTEKQEQLLAQASELTGLSLNKLNEMIFNHGVEYMEKLGDLSIVNSFIREPLYWAWWRQQWALIDAAFIADPDRTYPGIAFNYEHLHRQIDFYPDRLVFEKIHKSYETMSQQIIKHSKHKEDAL